MRPWSRPPRSRDEDGSATEDTGFRVAYLPNGEIIVTLAATCELSTVHDLCELIAAACLDGDPDIDFTRDPTEADTRIRTLDQ